MVRLACYERVSTEQQAGPDKTSLATQRARCDEFARELGATSIVHLSDAFTGTELERPGMSEMLRLVDERAVDGVVFYNVDRTARNSLVSLTLFERIVTQAGLRMWSAVDRMELTEQQFMYEIRSVIASYERRQILERMGRGKRARKQAGKPSGYVQPYGYTFVRGERRVEINPKDAEVVRTIFRWCATESIGSYNIARRLTEQGIPSPRGGTVTRSGKVYSTRWNYGQVYEMLRNTTYVDGIVRRKDEQKDWEPLRIEPIIDQQLWDTVQQVLERWRQLGTRGASPKHEYLAQRLVSCGHCGLAMTARPSRQTTRSNEARVYTYYCCPGRYERRLMGSDGQAVRCVQPPINAADVDELAWSKVLLAASDPEGHIRALSKDRATSGAAFAERRKNAQSRRDVARGEEERLTEAWVSGALKNRSLYESMATAIERRIHEAEAELRSIAQAESEQHRLSLTVGAMRAQADIIASRGDDLTFSERRDMLRQWVRRIVITDREMVIEMAVSVASYTGSIEKKAMKKIERELATEQRE